MTSSLSLAGPRSCSEPTAQRQGLVFQTSAGCHAVGRRGKRAALGPSSLHPPGQRGREERGSQSAPWKLLKWQISLQTRSAPPHPGVQVRWSWGGGHSNSPPRPGGQWGRGLPHATLRVPSGRDTHARPLPRAPSPKAQVFPAAPSGPRQAQGGGVSAVNVGRRGRRTQPPPAGGGGQSLSFQVQSP